MNTNWEKKVKQAIEKEIGAVDFSDTAQNRILEHIHHEIRKRRIFMKLTKKQTGMIIAAALVVLSGLTVFGAGKVAYLMSGHGIDDEVQNLTELKTQADAALGEAIRLPEKFSDGTAFSRGVVSDVIAHDKDGNQVGTFPNVTAYYKGKTIILDVDKPIDGINNTEKTAQQKETYQNIQISGYIDSYLFLPPDAQPSESDQKLQEEGKLEISYGSSKEERKSFTYVSWKEEELSYLLSTFEDIPLENMMKLAKEVIACEK